MKPPFKKGLPPPDKMDAGSQNEIQKPAPLQKRGSIGVKGKAKSGTSSHMAEMKKYGLA